MVLESYYAHYSQTKADMSVRLRRIVACFRDLRELLRSKAVLQTKIQDRKDTKMPHLQSRCRSYQDYKME
jgi:hypothetical protein